MRYVGITGFVSRTEVHIALDVLPEGLTLMCGVLVSEKTLRGERNKWWRRYPPAFAARDIFSTDPRCLNLIHYCSDVPPSAGVISDLQACGGLHCHGFQFNGAWPTPATLSGLSGDHVVLQYRPGKSSLDGLREAARAMRNVTAHVLIDVSGGRGIPIDSVEADALVGLMRERLPGVHIGVAGGLCAETLPAIAAVVRENRLSIDAEGRLRDGDEGGTLNLDKASAYLRAAGEVML